jgi:hypothetical protein
MAGAAAAADLRVLVATDVLADAEDGSSAGKDALELLIELLPSGSQAGIWTYNDSVAALAPYGTIDEHWRSNAASALRELEVPDIPPINLETALIAAASKWRESGPERHLLLIMSPEPPSVDLRPAAQRSRARIMNEALPALRAARVRVHVITCGKGEVPLAGRLAAASAGVLLHASTEDELAARILELTQVLRPLELPARHGEIIVDQGVEQLNLVLPRAQTDLASEIRAPDGRRYRADAAASGLRWRQTPTHEIVTIVRPEPGAWRIDPASADIRAWFDGAPRILPAKTPLRILAGDQLNLHATVEDGAGTATVTVNHQRPDGSAQLLARDTADRDRPLRIEIPRDLAPGTHWLTIEAAGPGFQRAWRQRLEVLDSPLRLEFTRNQGKPRLSLMPWADILRHEDLHIGATLTDEKRFVARLQAARSAPQEWQLDLAEYESPRTLQLTLETAGTRARGGVLLHQDRPRGFDVLGLHEPEPLPARTATPATTSRESLPRRPPELLVVGAAIAMISAVGIALLLAWLLRENRSSRRPAAARAVPAMESVRPAPAPVSASPTAANAAIPDQPTKSEPAPVPPPEATPVPPPAPVPAGEIYYSDDTVLPDMAEDPLMAAKNVDTGKAPSPIASGGAGGSDPLADIDIAGIELDFSGEEAAGTA